MRPDCTYVYLTHDIDFAASLTEAERRLYALPDDHIYVVYKVRE